MTDRAQTESRFFLFLVSAVTLALALVLKAFFGAILWAVVTALMFRPLNDWLLKKTGGRATLAALLTMGVLLLVVIVPTLLLASAIVNEVLVIYDKIRTGGINIGHVVQQIEGALPRSTMHWLQRNNFGDIDSIREQLTGGVANGVQAVATRTLAFSQSAFGFFIALGVMLYLSFFLLRDGDNIAERIERAVPLRPALYHALLDKIVTVIRATVKGSFVVAVVQGGIGGVTFSLMGIDGALLWGIIMGFFSLVPAIGSGLVWVPMALYLFIVGATWKAIILIFVGTFVIGMVDNLLRPLLVGRDTRMPDYAVFISTLGGIELFGFNGIVVGPVIASLFMAIWEIYGQTRQTPSAQPAESTPAN